MIKNTTTEKIFSYGTLQQENVQIALFGRKLLGSPDMLVGYRLSEMKIMNPHAVAASGIEFHPVLVHTNVKEDIIKGIVFDITPEELVQADKYEEPGYKRIRLTLHSGISAWVYVDVNTPDDL